MSKVKAEASRKLYARITRSLAAHNANRHLSAYLLERNPRHIAAAWRDYRKVKVAPSKAMLRWLDCLAADVLVPKPATRRPRENLVRDLEIYRHVQSFRHHRGEQGGTKLKDGEIYAAIGKPRGLAADHVKAIVSRVKAMLEDPFYRPKAFR